MAGFEEFLLSACGVLGIALPLWHPCQQRWAPRTLTKTNALSQLFQIYPPTQTILRGIMAARGFGFRSIARASLTFQTAMRSFKLRILNYYSRGHRTHFCVCEFGWWPKRDTDNLILWAPREYNVVADHLANAAMDS